MITDTKKDYLNAEDVLEVFKQLSNSQGFYCRLYEVFSTDVEAYEELESMCEYNKFKDAVDVVMFFEC